MSSQIAVLRKVTVYNTSAVNNRVIESSAMTWGELQQELERSGIPYSGMRAVIGENQNELITGQSGLMEGDMTLFLMPRRVKSGVINLSHLVNPDGIRYNEYNWKQEGVAPEDEAFITHYDLAMALQQKAQYYSELATIHFGMAEGLIRNSAVGTLEEQEEDDDDDDDYEYDDYNDDDDENEEEQSDGDEVTQYNSDFGFKTVRTLDPETAKLRQQAAEIERNMQAE